MPKVRRALAVSTLLPELPFELRDSPPGAHEVGFSSRCVARQPIEPGRKVPARATLDFAPAKAAPYPSRPLAASTEPFSPAPTEACGGKLVITSSRTSLSRRSTLRAKLLNHVTPVAQLRLQLGHFTFAIVGGCARGELQLEGTLIRRLGMLFRLELARTLFR